MTERSYKENAIAKLYRNSCVGLSLSVERNANTLLFALGVLLLSVGTAGAVFAQGDTTGGGLYQAACGFLLGFIEGPFGALITVGAGIGAIIASAVGGFKMAWTLVVVAVGAFILRAWITLFFAAC